MHQAVQVNEDLDGNIALQALILKHTMFMETSFIHPFNSTCHMPGTAVGMDNTAVHQTVRSSCPAAAHGLMGKAGYKQLDPDSSFL